MSSRREILEKFFLLWLFCSTNQCGVACCGFYADKPLHARLVLESGALIVSCLF